MKIKLNNKVYSLYLLDGLVDDKNRELDAFVDYDLNEITLDSNLSLKNVRSACVRIALSLILNDENKLSFLTNKQKDLLVNLLGDKFCDVNLNASAIESYVYGFMSK